MATAEYTTRIIKGGALIPDLRLLTTKWSDSSRKPGRGTLNGALSHLGRKRAHDVVTRVFVPRFVRSDPPDLWQPLAVLERAGWAVDRLRPIHFYAAATAEPILADVVRQLLEPRYAAGGLEVGVQEVTRFIQKAPAARFASGRWSEATAIRVARGVLSALRDFGVLSGAANKSIAPQVLPVPSFAFLARARFEAGVRGVAILRDPAWKLFYLAEPAVEELFVEAHQRRFLEYHAAGSVVRVDFPGRTFVEYAETLVERAD